MSYRKEIITQIKNYRKAEVLYVDSFIGGNTWDMKYKIWDLAFHLENIYNILLDQGREGLLVRIIIRKYDEVYSTHKNI